MSSSDVEAKVIRQVEFYFSDSNLPKDKFMRSQCALHPEGYVSIDLIASFKRMQEITTDVSAVVAALRKSTKLQVSDDGKMVRRIEPLPEVDTSFGRTVYVEGIPEDSTIESATTLFSQLGKVLCVRLKKDKKGSAFVEYSTEEEMKKACEQSEKFTANGKNVTILALADWKLRLKEDAKKQQQVQNEEQEKQTKDALSAKIKGKIIHITGLGQGNTREQLQALVASVAKVEYTDYSKDQTEGYLRFASEEDTKKVIAQFGSSAQTVGESKDVHLSLVTGDAETNYINTLFEKKMKGDNNRKGGNKRKRGGEGQGNNKRRKTKQ